MAELYKLALISDTESLSIFRIMGVDYYFVSEEETEETFQKIYNQTYNIIFLTENVFKKCSKYIQKERTYPVVTVMPDLSSKNELSRQNLLELSRIATGTYFLFQEEKQAKEKI